MASVSAFEILRQLAVVFQYMPSASITVTLFMGEPSQQIYLWRIQCWLNTLQ